MQKQTQKQRELEQLKFDEQKNQLKLLDAPGSLLNATPEQLTAFSEQTGVPEFMLQSMQTQQLDMQAAKGVDRQIKQNQLKASVLEYQRSVNPVDVKALGELNVLKQQFDAGAITQSEFDQQRKSIVGLKSPTEQQIEKLKIAELKATTEEQKLKIQGERKNLQQMQTIYLPGENPIDKLSFFESGQKIDKRYGPGALDYAGECAAFVNDIVGIPYSYGSSFASKSSHINNTNVENPVAGSIFISSRGNAENGHVGFVKSVNDDGTVTLADVNRDGNGEYNERNVPIGSLATEENIVGYENIPTSSTTGGLPRDVQKTINSVFVPGSSITYSQAAGEYSGVKNIAKLGAFNRGYNKRKSQLINSPDTVDKMLGSSGGKPIDTNLLTSLQKTNTAIQNISDLSDVLNKDSIESSVKGEEGSLIDLSPFTGWLESRFPWSEEGALTNAAITQAIPNLARGVYGEVGVLTDADVQLYKNTLPNLSEPEEIRKSITALTLRSVKNALDMKFRSAANAGRNVSGFITDYKTLTEKINSLETELGVVTNEEKLKQEQGKKAEQQAQSDIELLHNGNQVQFTPEETAQADDIFN